MIGASHGSTSGESMDSISTPTARVDLLSSIGSGSIQLNVHRLNGKNYLEWAQTMKLVIDAKGKLGHLTGEVNKPAEDDPNYVKWRSENSMITAWLINSMEPAIGKPFQFLLTAKEVWDGVKETYSDVENSSQIFALKTQLWNNKQGN